MTDFAADVPILHLLCGKIASGKSTLAQQLVNAPRTLVLSEDSWLAGLFGPEMKNVTDYVNYAARLRETLTPHLVALLNTGTSVVLDFPANTIAQRQWMKQVVMQARCAHILHFLDEPDSLCKARLAVRNEAKSHNFAATEAEYALISRYFVAPASEEGFNIKRYCSHPG
ncbi:ATP-binding protein [Erwinia sp.]|uniref:AAA family ATPase n=1 Tax=Erwinia citreus TaxID=558 RepID=UPI0028963478|nr:ATP-binding protein [Erwinia sp.]